MAHCPKKHLNIRNNMCLTFLLQIIILHLQILFLYCKHQDSCLGFDI